MKKLLFTKLLMFLVISGIYAQQLGELDPTFNMRIGAGANDVVTAVAAQADGKTIIVGSFTQYGIVAKNHICRLNLDGTVDVSFNSGTGCNNLVTDLKIQIDGKIVIFGNFTSYNNVACNRIARLNPDGTIDNSFTAGTIANNGFSISLNAMAVQTDGKLIIGGVFSTYNGIAVKNIARLNVDGSLDTTFNIQSGPNNTVREIIVDANGKILIAGSFLNYNLISRNGIARLHADGSLDTSFITTTGASGIEVMSLQEDGKIIIGGSFQTYNSIPKSCLARVNTDGTLDNTFDIGTGANSFIESLKILTNGKILIGGMFTSFNGVSTNRIATINTNGSIDITFNYGTGGNDRVFGIAEKPDGKIVIAGMFTAINDTLLGRVAQLNSDGSVDSSFFNPSAFKEGPNFEILSLKQQTDGKILICGKFTTYNQIVRNRIARLNADGTLDSSFISTTGANSDIYKMAIQSDGKIVIVGQFTFYNGVSRSGIARLNNDGSIDTTFNPGTGVNAVAQCVAVQSDGKILVGGSFSTFNGVAKSRLVRLNSDGSIDATFDSGTGLNSTTYVNNNVNCISIQNSGKILISGEFDSYNGFPRNTIAQLNTNGTLDITFTANVVGKVSFSATQPDGKILLGGVFITSVNGVARINYARLNEDGTLDNVLVPRPFFSSNTGTYFGGSVSAMATQIDGKIIIGGFFTTYDAIPSSGLVRVDSTGAVDTVYNPNPLITDNNWVDNIIIQPDGKIVIVGTFNIFNKISINKIARLLPGTSVLSSTTYNKKSFTIYPNPSTGIFTIQTENPITNAKITVADLNGRFVHETKIENLDSKTLDLNNLQNGIYILNVSNGETKFSQKIIKQ